MSNANPVIGETVTVTGEVVDVEVRGPSGEGPSNQLVTIAIPAAVRVEPNRGAPIPGNRPDLRLAKGADGG